MGFRQSEVNRFFDNCKQVYEKEKFDPCHIYNMDETGMSTVQQQKEKILAQTGNKQIGKTVLAEKKRDTAVVRVSASGGFLLPMSIYLRKKFVVCW